MASERELVLESISASEDGHSSSEKLSQAISDGERTKQLSLSHDHEIKMRQTELGWFGLVFGGETHAPTVIAFVVVILGFGSAFVLWWLAYRTGRPEFWSSEAHVSLGAATSALAYVFGRGSKDPPK